MPSNLYLLENAAGKLGKLLDEVVFVGGSTLDLIVTDEAAAPIRGTVDVDVIAEITTYPGYVVFSEHLRELGFSEDTREAAHLCRWVHGDLTLDVMPLEKSVLGFSNRWYRGALETVEPSSGSSQLRSFWVPRWKRFGGEGLETSLQATTWRISSPSSKGAKRSLGRFSPRLSI
jgi:hypothetical protein